MNEIPEDIAKTARKFAEIQCGSDYQCVFPGPCQCRDAIALAILAERERQWQDIESAPKDGTEVLLWIPPNEYAPGFPEVAQYWAEPPRYAGWVGVRTHSPYYEATHWMPLPSPPSTIDRSQGGIKVSSATL